MTPARVIENSSGTFSHFSQSRRCLDVFGFSTGVYFLKNHIFRPAHLELRGMSILSATIETDVGIWKIYFIARPTVYTW